MIPAGHVINGALWIGGIDFMKWTPSAQSAVRAALASDVVPAEVNNGRTASLPLHSLLPECVQTRARRAEQDMVFVSTIADASVPSSWSQLAGPPMPSGARGVLIAYQVDGYQCSPAASQNGTCSDAGFSMAAIDAGSLDNVGPSSAVGAAVKKIYGAAATVQDVSSGGAGAGDTSPAIQASIGLGMNLFFAPDPSVISPVDVMEAEFDAMLNSARPESASLAELLQQFQSFACPPAVLEEIAACTRRGCSQFFWPHRVSTSDHRPRHRQGSAYFH